MASWSIDQTQPQESLWSCCLSLGQEMNLGIGTNRNHPGSETGSSGEMLRECLQQQIGSTSQISKSGTIFHLEDEKGCTEEELQPEILYAIAEDLELELQNSLSLRLHPSSEEPKSEDWRLLSITA